MVTFAQAFQDQLKLQSGAATSLKNAHPILFHMIMDPAHTPRQAARKKARLERMEEEVRSKMGYSKTQAIDWSTIDWTKLLTSFFQILAAILPFLMIL